MKVLAISSSPRLHGNSDFLCDQFLKGAAEAGHSVEKVRLAEKSILPMKRRLNWAKPYNKKESFLWNTF